MLDSSAFGEPPKLSLTRIGSYQFRDNHFLQIWCPEQATRQEALRQRALGIATLPEITSEAQLMERMRTVAAALQVPELTTAQLRTYAESRGESRRLERLSV